MITMVLMNTLPQRLSFARELAGISARDLDRLAQLAEGHTRMIETGKRPRLEIDTVTGLASALGCALAWLVTGEGDAPDAATVRAAIAAARARRVDDSGAHPAVPATGTDQ